MAMTTRTQLIEAVDFACATQLHKDTRLNSCKAWYFEINIDGQSYIVLQSYATHVALYSPATGTVYSFDRYSSTTTQHLHKFAHQMKAARITKLYRDTTGVVEIILWQGKVWKLTAAQWRDLIDRDFQGYIETIVRRVAE